MCVCVRACVHVCVSQEDPQLWNKWIKNIKRKLASKVLPDNGHYTSVDAGAN